MKQIVLKVNIIGPEDWMEDHDVTGKSVTELLESTLDNVEGIASAIVSVEKEDNV